MLRNHIEFFSFYFLNVHIVPIYSTTKKTKLVCICRVVVEPARGQARGSHRDRYNDRDSYSSRRGGGRYNNDKWVSIEWWKSSAGALMLLLNSKTKTIHTVRVELWESIILSMNMGPSHNTPRWWFYRFWFNDPPPFQNCTISFAFFLWFEF